MRFLITAIVMLGSAQMVNAEDIKAKMAQVKDLEHCRSSEFSEEIIPACTRLIEDPATNPSSQDFYAYRGAAHFFKNDHDEAEADFSEALRLTAGDRWHWYNDLPAPNLARGIIRLKKRQLSEALDDFDQAISQKPSDLVGYYFRGRALEAMSKNDWALLTYKTGRGFPVTDNANVPPAPYWQIAVDRTEMDKRIDKLSAVVSAEQAVPADAKNPGQMLAQYLYAGKIAAAEQMMLAYTKDRPNDQEGHYALGTAQFLLAVEHLGQSLYRYGLEKPESTWISSSLPFLRLPVPYNPRPDVFRYEDARTVLKTFVSDLAHSEASLAKVDDDKVGLPINLGLVRLDLNSDGKVSEDESLWQLYAATSGAQIDEQQAKLFTLRLDRGDAAWMRGYSHLLSSMAEALLAHDWQNTFDTVFFRFFPHSSLPNSSLGSADAVNIDKGDRDIADFITFIHLMHWDVREPERMKSALGHLESVAAMSRLSWTYILAERDNDHEWIPNPAQAGVMAGMRVSPEIVAGWLGFIDQFDGMLKGKILIPHWRFAEGINLNRVFTEPTLFDPILWVQGTAALPYLEKGPMASNESWTRLEQLFEGNFFGYAVWFN